jgi:hypothetical protein
MTDTSTGGWPDAARPGYPQNPERDGWHWLGDDRRPQPVLWLAEFASWADGTMHSPQSVVGLGFRYLGPCLLPSEVAAQVEAARRDEREANAALIDCGCDNRDAVLARLESKGERYAAYLCQQGSACCALQAATIRARGDA